ncbi:similar to Saccharomyces cerevisiae YLR151C PCD1 Peroxisomal nudix pyrophosphatase with specificity for coenzyme A and CoA derivatives [Maudiozyma saulgeensis]|uniref:Similar to Saccharomyces cerevisiae YLR151C PCD1 Peroxisomal nudix pyrophosphatase with specificity for coenzyme A and CoA derivatives n=1 Tax=Maudiozyma saulgeensis TaxID=1789683 RepID=A0A1X7R4S5_9SACH|nr:similar to Saccharomyces cerevisiae YLR151C PCD1 Peroxisomal nudix pyrophosphatase with specificity for coenzyme A and CoA derivatives [Kazachstania saulgeensis]
MFKSVELLKSLSHFKYHRQFDLNSVWPSGRRSAVLVLLFIGSRGELRVLLTKRSRSLRNFSGHVSFPGGKADNDNETFEEVARREAEEEIGLPRDPLVLSEKFEMAIENISLEFPCYISRTLLSVKPLICFLHNHVGETSSDSIYESPLDISKFFGKLNPGETSSIFSIPLNDLIADTFPKALGYTPEYINHKEYVGNWGGIKWDIRHLYYPVNNQNEAIWLNEVESLSSDEEYADMGKVRDVWGLTAKILTDISKVANGLNVMSPPSKSSQLHFNHEKLLHALFYYGKQLQPTGRSEWEKQLINNNNNIRYEDKIPAFYMDYLQHSGKF